MSSRRSPHAGRASGLTGRGGEGGGERFECVALGIEAEGLEASFTCHSSGTRSKTASAHSRAATCSTSRAGRSRWNDSISCARRARRATLTSYATMNTCQSVRRSTTTTTIRAATDAARGETTMAHLHAVEHTPQRPPSGSEPFREHVAAQWSPAPTHKPPGGDSYGALTHLCNLLDMPLRSPGRVLSTPQPLSCPPNPWRC